jgi:hypothetical protein
LKNGGVAAPAGGHHAPTSSADGNSSFNSDAPTMPADENSLAPAILPAYSPSGGDMRTVRIEKHGETPLGATIRIDDDNNGNVVVARIVHGGAAQKSGEWALGHCCLLCLSVCLSVCTLFTAPVNLFSTRFQGLLHEGDVLWDVNGVDLRGRSLDEVCELLVSVCVCVFVIGCIVGGDVTSKTCC